VEGSYPDSAAKASLVATVGIQAKTYVVSEFGVGETITMTIFAWKNDELVCIAGADMNWGDFTNTDERLQRISTTSLILRKGFHADALTLLAEGWVSLNPDKTRGKDLAQQFAEGTHSDVDECLTICHVEDEGNLIDVCAKPFTIQVGKQVKFAPLVHSDDPSMLRNSDYIHVMTTALRAPTAPAPTNEETYRLALAMGLADDAGFLLHYDL